MTAGITPLSTRTPAPPFLHRPCQPVQTSRARLAAEYTKLRMIVGGCTGCASRLAKTAYSSGFPPSHVHSHVLLNVMAGPVVEVAYEESVRSLLRFNCSRSRMRHLQHGHISLFRALLHVAHTRASLAVAPETRQLIPVGGRGGRPHRLCAVLVGRFGPARKRRSVVIASSVWGADSGGVYLLARVLWGKAVPPRRSIQGQLSRNRVIHRKSCERWRLVLRLDEGGSVSSIVFRAIAAILVVLY